ncbi:Uncharacterised protein [Segatella copri]|nr:Uncharacterised protein [Segatella copri]
MLVKSTTVGLVMKLLAKTAISQAIRILNLLGQMMLPQSQFWKARRRTLRTQIIVVTDLMSDIGIVSCRLKLVSHSLSLI